MSYTNCRPSEPKPNLEGTSTIRLRLLAAALMTNVRLQTAPKPRVGSER
jgi:hypothetical protein